MKIHTLFGLWAALGVHCLAGCGGGNTIWVTGVLQKGGQPYKPLEERKLALFGKMTSPFVRDLKSSTKLTLDMAKPTV